MAQTQLKEVGKTFRNPEVQEFNNHVATETELVLERISLLLNGDYGYDELMQLVNAKKNHPRINMKAIVFQAIAGYEWAITQAQANQVYSNQFTSVQDKLNNGIEKLLNSENEYNRRLA